MKKENLKFRSLPKISSRRFRALDGQFRSTAYKTDGDGGGDDEGEEKEKKAFLDKIKGEVKTEIERRGYQNADAINGLLDTKLKDINLDGLRNFDTVKLNKTLTDLAAEQEKIKANGTGGEQKRVNPLKAFLNENADKIDLALRSKDKNQEIKFNIRAAAVMTTDNTLDENNYPEEMIESMSMAEFVPKRQGTQYIYDIADRTIVAEIDQYKTWLEEGDEQGAFAIVAEGGLKPLVSTSLVRNYAEAQKIAGKYVITEEFAKWRKNAFNIIKRLIQDKLYRDYAAILTTDLNAAAVAYTGTILDNLIVAPNDYDVIGAAAAQIEALNFSPDILILNPQDKWRIVLQKDLQGAYYTTIPVNQNGNTVMMGFKVITSTYQTAGTFTLGESLLFKIEEEPVTIRIGYGITVTGANPVTQVVSDFDNNQQRIIVETYFNNWIATNHTGSFVRDTFNNVKAALLKP